MVYAARRADAPIGAPTYQKRPEITELCSWVFDVRVEDARRIATSDSPELGTDCDETATRGRNRRWARRFLIRVLAGGSDGPTPTFASRLGGTVANVGVEGPLANLLIPVELWV